MRIRAREERKAEEAARGMPARDRDGSSQIPARDTSVGRTTCRHNSR